MFEVPPAAVRAALAEHLRPMLGDAPVPTTPPTRSALDLVAAKGSLLKAGLLFLAGAVTGAVATSAARSPFPPEVRYVEVERVAERAAPREVDAATPAVSASVTPVVAPPRSATAPSPSSRVVTDDRLAEERSLVETARSALARRDSTRALESTREHEQRFPRGRLVEEREALAIQALSASGRGEEARARAQKFRVRYPQGLFLPVVEAAIGDARGR